MHLCCFRYKVLEEIKLIFFVSLTFGVITAVRKTSGNIVRFTTKVRALVCFFHIWKFIYTVGELFFNFPICLVMWKTSNDLCREYILFNLVSLFFEIMRQLNSYCFFLFVIMLDISWEIQNSWLTTLLSVFE